MTVTPTDALKSYVSGESSVMSIASEDEAVEAGADVLLVTANLTKNEEEYAVSDADNTTLSGNIADIGVVTRELIPQGKENNTTIYIASQANPSFTVQYYAEIEVVASVEKDSAPGTILAWGSLYNEYSNILPLIDTSNGGMAKRGICLRMVQGVITS